MCAFIYVVRRKKGTIDLRVAISCHRQCYWQPHHNHMAILNFIGED